MNKLLIKYEILDYQWILAIGIMVSSFLYSGYNTERFQNSREDVHIESLLDLHSQKVGAISFWDIFKTNPVFNTYLFSEYGLFQLRVYNTSVLSYLTQFLNLGIQKELLVFFFPKSIPFCSEEDSPFTIMG